MAFVNKGKKWQYFVCDNHRRGLDCDSKSIKYRTFEKAVLSQTQYLNIAKIINSKNDKITNQIDSIEKRILAIDGMVDHSSNQINNISDTIANTPYKNSIEILSEKMDNLVKKTEAFEQDRQDLTKQKSELLNQISEVEHVPRQNNVDHFTP